jgi:cell division septation protein DedD
MVQERRQHVRRVPISPLVVCLGESRSALLLDASEGGVALASIMPRTVDELITLSMDLPEGKGRIEAKAEVAWTREAGHLSGVRFVELDEPVRKQLSEWLWPEEEFAAVEAIEVDGLADVIVANEPEHGMPAVETAELDESADVVAMNEPEHGMPAVETAELDESADVAAANELEHETSAVETVEVDEFADMVPVNGMEHEIPAFETSEGPEAIALPEMVPAIPTEMNAVPASRDMLPDPSRWTGSLFPLTSDGGEPVEKGRYPIRLFLAVMVLTWALVFVGYRMGSKNEVPHIGENPAAAGPSESAVDSASVSDVEAAAPTVMPEPATKRAMEAPARPAVTAPSIERPGFVLQVGAMKREGNADSLAESLQKKKLPAFVFQHGDRFYRVAVGPFSDSDSAARAKSTLEKNGLKAILRRWSPE